MMQGFSIKDLPCHFPFPTLPPLELFSHYPSPELGSLCTDVPLHPEKRGGERLYTGYRQRSELFTSTTRVENLCINLKLKTLTRRENNLLQSISKSAEDPIVKIALPQITVHIF